MFRVLCYCIPWALSLQVIHLGGVLWPSCVKVHLGGELDGCDQMVGKFSYLLWLTIFVWFPTLVLWATNFDILRRYKKTLSFCIFWALVFSLPWDIIAVKSRIWSFPTETNIGLSIGGLPLEEYFYIIFVTFFVSSLTLVLKNRLVCKR